MTWAVAVVVGLVVAAGAALVGLRWVLNHLAATRVAADRLAAVEARLEALVTSRHTALAEAVTTLRADHDGLRRSYEADRTKAAFR